MIVFLSYIFYFIAASISPLQRRWLAKKKDIDGKGQVHFAFQVSCIVFGLSLLLPFFSPFYITGNIWHIIILFLITGIFGAGVIYISYTIQKHVEAGVNSMVSNIYTPITIVFATLFLHEALTILQIAGTALLLIGIVVVSKKHTLGRFKFDKYFWLMILAGVLLALDISAERMLQKITGFTAGTMLMLLAQCLFLGIAACVTRSKSHYSARDIGITGILRYFQILSWAILVFVVGNLSIVSSITTFKVVIIFIGAAIFLKERDDIPRKVLGSLIAVAGLLLMK